MRSLFCVFECFWISLFDLGLVLIVVGLSLFDLPSCAVCVVVCYCCFVWVGGFAGFTVYVFFFVGWLGFGGGFVYCFSWF